MAECLVIFVNEVEGNIGFLQFAFGCFLRSSKKFFGDDSPNFEVVIEESELKIVALSFCVFE